MSDPITPLEFEQNLVIVYKQNIQPQFYKIGGHGKIYLKNRFGI